MDELKKDDRFSHITKDPRFRPASKKESKLKIDRRFSSMFNDPKFKLKYTVDKRGRPLVKERTTRDDMKKFYHLEKDDDQSSSTSSEDDEPENRPTKKQKKGLTGDEQMDEFLKSDDSDEEKDDDDEENEEDDGSSSSDDDELPEVDDGMEWNEFDEKCVRSEDMSHRLAVCNMDWDRVRAVDIFLLMNSWKPADGVIKSVTIYPSEYGSKQMALETKLGPLPGTAQPVAVTTDQTETAADRESDAEEEPDLPEVKSDDDEEINVENFNQDDDPDVTDPVMRERLRKYQLNRLKYYYAVVECDTVETAAKIYEECDGLEYETSAVRLDLRFIPDSVKFDDSMTPHDRCNELPDKSIYKPILFRNTALTQTKVRCTWDETPIDRRRLTRKKYTLEELEKVDLDAYLASGSDEDLPDDDNDENAASDIEDESETKTNGKNGEAVFKVPSVPVDQKKKKIDKPIARAPSMLSSQDDIERYRALLLDFDDDSKTKKKSKKKIDNFFDAEPSDDEEEIPRQTNPDDDDDDDDDASDIDMEITWQPGLKAKVEEQFQKKTEDKNIKKKDKNKRSSKREEEEEEDDEEIVENDDEDTRKAQKESLELLTVDDELDGKRNYNLRQMIKAQKQLTKAEAKKKKSKKFEKNPVPSTNGKSDADQFQLNVEDKRFAAVYSQAAFNIDQTDPQFKATAGTQLIIDEKLKKRKLEQTNGPSRTTNEQDDLVAKLKRKSTRKD